MQTERANTPRLFITGAAGYVGSRLVGSLPPALAQRAVCLTRRLPETAVPGIRYLQADLLDTVDYAAQLRDCDTVIHLAAVTRKTWPRNFFRGNVQATRQLVVAAGRAGVRKFLHVSTIAVAFADQKRFFYAQSKKLAEEVVAESGLDFTILRPTMVIGPGAPELEGLAKMAAAPIMPVFGDGDVTVQPVYVDDLIRGILAIIEERRFRRETIEFGGPEVLSIEEFLWEIRLQRFGKAGRAIHLPIRPTRMAIGLLERVFLPLLPMTAGQLSLFTNDGTTRQQIHVAPHIRQRKDVAEVLQQFFSTDSAL